MAASEDYFRLLAVDGYFLRATTELINQVHVTGLLSGLLMFSGGIETDQQNKMSYT